MTLFVHVVDPREATVDRGMVAELLPHAETHPDWDTCGVVARPGQPCDAFSAGTGERCGKREAVVYLEGRTKFSRGEPQHAVFLCGGHLIVHRSGKPVRISVVLARGR